MSTLSERLRCSTHMTPRALQMLFAWYDHHLYQFRYDNRRFEAPESALLASSSPVLRPSAGASICTRLPPAAAPAHARTSPCTAPPATAVRVSCDAAPPQARQLRYCSHTVRIRN